MRQTVNVVIVASIAVATIGLISGIEGTARDSRARPEPSPYVDPRPSESRSYRDMRAIDYGPNARLPAAWFESIRVPTEPAGDLDRNAWAARRAYDGAPPVVPHPVDQHAVAACLACHEHGVKVAGRIAPITTHPRRDSCLQCHVVATDPRSARDTPPTPETNFIGTPPAPNSIGAL